MTRFGRLTLLEETSLRRRGGVVGRFLCDCGVEKLIPMVRVRCGNAKSCGCLRVSHGQTGTDEYRAWCAMKARCRPTTARDNAGHKSLGITVCGRWRKFENFIADMGPRPSPRHSIDRIDNTKGYEPSNCRWAIPTQQMQNTRRSKVWHVCGRTFGSCREAGRHFGVDSSTIRYWVKTGREGSYAISRY